MSVSKTLTEADLSKLLALSSIRGLLTDLEKALVIVRDYRYSVRSTSQQFGIPFSTLQRSVAKNDTFAHTGRPRKLEFNKEKELANWVKAKARQADAVTMSEVINQVCIFLIFRCACDDVFFLLLLSFFFY